MHLLQEVFELNQAFERVIEGLKRMEKLRFLPADMVREDRAEVMLAQPTSTGCSSRISVRTMREKKNGLSISRKPVRQSVAIPMTTTLECGNKRRPARKRGFHPE